MGMKSLLALTLSALLLAGCAPIIVGAGAAAGYVGIQERSFKEAGEDIAIKARLVERIGRMKASYLKDVNISVRHGEAFITGVVDSQEDIHAIGRRAENAPGVRDVINALQLKPYPVKQYLADVATGTNLRSRLLFEEDVFPPNYEITLVKGEVFLFGWAYTQAEIDHVVHIARTTKGVDKVHNYLRVMENGRQKLQERKRATKDALSGSYGVDEVQ